MKNIVAACCVMLPVTAFAVPNLTCNTSGVENAYQVTFNESDLTATIKHNGKVAEFGNLKCYLLKQPYGAVARCYSPYVADAGYNAIFNHDKDTGFSVSVTESSFFGSKQVADLPCWQN